VQGTQGIQGTTGNAETSLQEVRGFALSDETTALTVSQRLGTHWPNRFVIKSLYGSVNTAPSGSAITVDLEIGGSSVLSTGLLQIAAGATTGATDAFASGKSDWTIEQGDWTTFDIDQIGSSIAGAGLKVYLKGYTTGL
jgi:hypothetical protein